MIEVALLGKMEFFVNGKNAESVVMSSRKGSQMLLYLLLNYGKSVPSTTLYEVLWPNQTSSNPENALKTLVSRLRSAFAAFDDDLRKCISTDHGAYRWNTEIETNLDTLQLEKACGRALQIEEVNEELNQIKETVLSLYGGDLVIKHEEESWFLSRRTYYHGLFLKAVQHMIDVYKSAGDYDHVVQICRAALDLDAFDEQLHVELMDSLIKTNRSSEALAQYRHMTNLHYSYLGMPPSENLQSFYKQIAKADQSLDMDIEAIRRTLEDSHGTTGAFVCDYAIFKDVYQLQMRNLQRLGTTMYIGIIMLSPVPQEQVEPLELDRAMHQLLNAMITCLRKGDTIARYSPTQFALLLPTINASTGRTVIRRIRNAYYSERVNPSLVFSYKLAPLGPFGK